MKKRGIMGKQVQMIMAAISASLFQNSESGLVKLMIR
jgi:hypothetical protein